MKALLYIRLDTVGSAAYIFRLRSKFKSIDMQEAPHWTSPSTAAVTHYCPELALHFRDQPRDAP